MRVVKLFLRPGSIFRKLKFDLAGQTKTIFAGRLTGQLKMMRSSLAQSVFGCSRVTGFLVPGACSEALEPRGFPNSLALPATMPASRRKHTTTDVVSRRFTDVLVNRKCPAKDLPPSR